jgi:hypothetical protein
MRDVIAELPSEFELSGETVDAWIDARIGPEGRDPAD